MENYKKMYLLLFNAITTAITDLEQANCGLAKEHLMAAQQQCEELYMADDKE